jgi:hypothetical protein
MAIARQGSYDVMLCQRLSVSRFSGQELQVPQRNRLTATQPTLDPRGRKAPELLAPLTIQEA